MANKNDLRFIKTERLIESTYMQLKCKALKQGHTAVKVNELCETALINKTTFYAHYETMSALHKHICEREVDRILSECPPIDIAFSDTSAFVNSIVQAVMRNAQVLRVLFGDDKAQYVNAFEAGLLKRYLEVSIADTAAADAANTVTSDAANTVTSDAADIVTPDMDAKIRFCIGGAARLLLEEQSPTQMLIVIDLIKKIL